MKQIAVYARVSTSKKGADAQDVETQLRPLRAYAASRQFASSVFPLKPIEYIDVGVSGAKEKRPALDHLMADARQRKFDAVVVWKFDRFARSTTHLLRALEEFNALGIDFISLTENIDTSTPMGKMVFTMVGAFAQFERELIKERVAAGMARAKAQGKTFGRPRRIINHPVAIAFRAQGMSVREIARRMGVPKSTLHSLKDVVT